MSARQAGAHQPGELAAAAASEGFWTKTLLLVVKDLRVESRGRETLPPMLVFALTVTLLLAFAIPAGTFLRPDMSLALGSVPLANVLAAFFWITVLFAGLIGFSRTFETERENAAIDPLLLVPLDRSALFLSKALGNLSFIALLQVALVPLFFVLFDIRVGPVLGPLVLVIVVVDLGFVATGTLFASVAAQTRSRELVLPILALPVLVPIFIGAVELTSDLFLGRGLGEVAGGAWFGLLIGYDLIFGIVGALAFEFVVE